ncbi:prevent-host-death protein [Saccharobesus litoralis]|uniref:Prevent-host-death protein n=1 Tax=Saccharobesus litoralis TaxID=2172099 RepID=A0A2S0VRK5_9ALTE|nr:prevent-host-death protein [Saccharobesus litoralis]AWB66851.1 prevent-host-death protein [Saccharobesus litoralis]
MFSLTANELKKGGVTALDKAMQSDSDKQVVIDVRGKAKYIVLEIDEYNAYREYELDKAIAEAKADYLTGNYDEVNDFEALAKELKQD